MTATPSARSVLVLRFGSFGDVILTSPAMEALRKAWPQAHIAYAVKAAYADLMRRNPYVDEVVPLHPGENLVAFSRRLGNLGSEAVLDLHGKMRSKILRRLLRPSRQAVWRQRAWYEPLLVYPALRPYRPQVRLSDRHHAAVEALVGGPLPRGELRHFMAPGDVEEAESRMDAAGVESSRPVVGMSPGSAWETKRWPVERFAALATRAIESGLQAVVVGGPSEVDLGRRIAALEPRAVDLTGQLPLAPLGGFLYRCAAFVANDSGPMHMARALGVPTLALFGSTHPGQFDFAGHRALYANVPCAPCSFHGRPLCPRGHFECMRGIEVDAAWRELEPLLRGGRRPFVHA